HLQKRPVKEKVRTVYLAGESGCLRRSRDPFPVGIEKVEPLGVIHQPQTVTCLKRSGALGDGDEGFVAAVIEVQQGILTERLDEPNLGLKDPAIRLHAKMFGSQAKRECRRSRMRQLGRDVKREARAPKAGTIGC